MSRLREKWREEHAARSEAERVRVADGGRRARLRPRPLPAHDPAHTVHQLSLYLVLPPGDVPTPGLLDYAREIGANIIHGAADIDVRQRVGGDQSAPYIALEDLALRDEVAARVERELDVLHAPIGDDWAALTAPVRVSPLEGEACQLVLDGVGEPRLRLRVDGALVLDPDDRPAELGKERIFTVRYGDGPVLAGPRVVVEARQPKRGEAAVTEALVRVGPVRRHEVHRRWRRWSAED